MSILTKELIHIPEKVQRGDFVLNLASGLEADAIDQTLKGYVVTPQLARCFDDALSFVKRRVATTVGGDVASGWSRVSFDSDGSGVATCRGCLRRIGGGDADSGRRAAGDAFPRGAWERGKTQRREEE